MAKPIIIQGTGSFVGKSIIVAGLCQVLKQDGFRVAPFFENDGFRRQFIQRVQELKGRPLESGVGATDRSPLQSYRAFKEREYDKLALALRGSPGYPGNISDHGNK